MKEKNEKPKTTKTLNTYIIIFFVVFLAFLLTYIIPVGKFQTKDQYVWDTKHQELKEQVILDDETFEIVKDAEGDPLRIPAPLFGAYHGVGLFNYAFEGIVSAVSIVVFILIIGGAFGIILRTGAVELGMLSIIKRFKGRDIILIPVLFVLFALGGAVFGMGEEAIPFAMIIVPLMVAMGYDAITGILVTYGATQIGFATSWMNPFNVAIAQGIAGIPVLSGIVFRFIIFLVFLIVGTLITLLYARKIRKNPQKSVSYKTDDYFRKDFSDTESRHEKFSFGHVLIILIIVIGIVWVSIGVIMWDYYIAEIATQFFIMGFVAGIIGVIFKLNGMKVNDIATSFQSGAKDLLGAALVVGMARGIILLLSLGGDPTDPTNPNILNTILYYVGNGLRAVPSAIASFFMYLFQSVFNFFVSSGSGQAALTMPLMAPLSRYAGISRQVAVLAFQLGDGFTNLIVPTSGALMGVLAVAKVDWFNWAKFQIKFQGILFVLGSLFVIFATLGGNILGQDWKPITEQSIQTTVTEVSMELSSVEKPTLYDLKEGESKWIRLTVEEGKTYNVYLYDSYNNDYLDILDKNDAVQAVSFQLYQKDKETLYPTDIYTDTHKSGGVTPQSDMMAIKFTAVEDEVNLLVKGYEPDYTGKFGFKMNEGLEELSVNAEFKTIRIGEGDYTWLSARVSPDVEYELYVVDQFNVNQYENFNQDELIKSALFRVYKDDKTTAYPRGIYTQMDEDLDGGVTPQAVEVEEAPPASVFRAEQNMIYILIQGRNSEYSGKTGIKLIEK